MQLFDGEFINPFEANDLHKELAEKMYGGNTPSLVELASLKILISAIGALLLDKGIITQKELEEYTKQGAEAYKLLKKLVDK